MSGANRMCDSIPAAIVEKVCLRAAVVRFVAVVISLISLSAISGCGSQPSVKPVAQINPQQAANAAVTQHDKNSDGAIDEKEQSESVAIQALLKTADVDRDGRLSEKEIATRMETHRSISLKTMMGIITLNDQPLSGAAVQFVPAPFLGKAGNPATGTTDADGAFVMQTEGQTLPGVVPGIYTVAISKRDPAGGELVPPQFNVQSQLSVEVASDLPSTVMFNLKK